MSGDPYQHDGYIGGDKIGGDKITVGSISDSYTAIGEGAQVIVNQIQQALSTVDELEKSTRIAEKQLAEAIQRKIISYTQLTNTSDAVQPRNPYKSLLNYELEDAPFFYGRDEAINAMRERMRRSRLTILEADSGSGKTSLLKAGLSSRILAGGDFGLYLRPYNLQPVQAIKRAFLPDYDKRQDLTRFRDDSMGLHGFLERVSFYLGNRELAIFLDQFEEFFNELPRDQQEVFAAQLRDCVQSDLPVRWVLSMRKEYLSELRLFEALRPFDNRYFLPTFKIEEAQDVLIQPAALKGVRYEKGLVQKILADIGRQSEAIPPVQVQLVCYTLFEELEGEAVPSIITSALYEKPRGRGEGQLGAEGILTSHLTRVLDNRLTGKQRKVAISLLEALVTFDGRRDVRTKNSLSQEPELGDFASLDEVLSILVDNRVLRINKDDNDEYTYELAHDYLLHEIEVDPETKAKKFAQEILNQEVAAWEANPGLRIPQDKLAILDAQQSSIFIDQNAETLLKLSRTARRNTRIRNIGGLLLATLIIAVMATLAATGQIPRLIYQPLPAEMISIPASTFMMGSSPEEIEIAQVIEREFREQAQDDFSGENIEILEIEVTEPDTVNNQQPLEEISIETLEMNPIEVTEFSSYILINEEPKHEVLLSDFEIGKFEVTNKEYNQCVRSTECSPPDNKIFNDVKYADFPVTDVSWGQAVNYCSWTGGRLPTEAEWEKAARFGFGRDQPNQIYAWGEEADEDLANVFSGDNGAAMPVGSYSPAGDTPAGLVDITGNVWEWVADWYAEDYYETSSRGNSPPHNPSGPEDGYWRIVRGGSYDNDWVQARITFRKFSLRTGDSAEDVGFRCVR